MSNLRLLNETNVTSSVSTVNIQDVFTADYDIYKIMVSNTVTDTSTNDLSLRFLNTSSSAVSGTEYAYGFARLRSSGANEVLDTDNTKFTTGLGQSNSDLGLGTVAYVFNPYNYAYTFYSFESGGMSGTEGRTFIGAGVLKQLNTIGGFQMIADSNNITQSTIRTFGLRVD